MLEAIIDKMTRRYVITAAQKGATYNKNLMRNIEKYCSDHDAELIILPMKGRSVEDEELHRDLQLKTVIDSDFIINKNLKISNYQILPQQINPLTGIERFAQGDKSFIFASPKQVLKYVANSYDNIPKAVMTTGAITKPYYRDNRIGRIAVKDHTYGFVVVEKENNTYFHFRHVRALKNGNFTDVLGAYKNGKRYKVNAKALVVGDLHPGDTDPKHEKNTLEQINYFGGNLDVYLHDTFNGKSISHHYKGHNIQKHLVYLEQGLNLEKELVDTIKAVSKYTRATKGTVYIVPSNHDEHLYRYLDEGRFIGDKGNDYIASKLYTAALEGKNPLEYSFNLLGRMPSNLEFIPLDAGHKVLGYELGNHGHLGANGGRASPRSIEVANAKSVTGHGHSAFIIRNTYRVGTSTKLRLYYNHGFSNWTQTNIVLYTDGTVQLLNTINKHWRLNNG